MEVLGSRWAVFGAKSFAIKEKERKRRERKAKGVGAGEWGSSAALEGGTPIQATSLGISGDVCVLAYRCLAWWSRVVFTNSDLQAASRYRTLYALNELAESNQRGSLYRHLKELEFVKPADALSSETVVRSTVVWKRKTSGISGPCGSQYLESAVRAGTLREPSARFTGLKRDIDYRARRATEQRSRLSWPDGDMERKARTR